MEEDEQKKKKREHIRWFATTHSWFESPEDDGRPQKANGSTKKRMRRGPTGCDQTLEEEKFKCQPLSAFRNQEK